ncbi:hypothetical protein NFI96_026439, partial [Prochilodus magdalenae]
PLQRRLLSMGHCWQGIVGSSNSEVASGNAVSDAIGKEDKVAPQSSVYYKDEVELGSKNTLICYITGFYPPHVTVSWTRNDVNVTDEATLSRHYPTTVGTLNIMSHLSFTPAEGDIYTCTVEHAALDRPLTRTWDVQVALPGVGPSVVLWSGSCRSD